MVAQLAYGLMPARGLKPRKEVWRLEAWRMARGPKRAPCGGGGERVSLRFEVWRGWVKGRLRGGREGEVDLGER